MLRVVDSQGQVSDVVPNSNKESDPLLPLQIRNFREWKPPSWVFFVVVVMVVAMVDPLIE